MKFSRFLLESELTSTFQNAVRGHKERGNNPHPTLLDHSKFELIGNRLQDLYCGS